MRPRRFLVNVRSNDQTGTLIRQETIWATDEREALQDAHDLYGKNGILQVFVAPLTDELDTL